MRVCEGVKVLKIDFYFNSASSWMQSFLVKKDSISSELEDINDGTWDVITMLLIMERICCTMHCYIWQS